MTPEEIAAAVAPATEEQQKILAAILEPPKEPEPESVLLARRYAKHFTEHRKFVHVMSMGTVVASRRQEIRGAKCVVLCHHSGMPGAEGNQQYLVGRFQNGDANIPAQTTSNNIANATVFTVTEAVQNRNAISSVWIVGILDAEALALEPKSRKWDIETTLNIALLELAKVAPLNPTLTSHLARLMEAPPPADADTYQKLRDWMEFEFNPPYFTPQLRQYMKAEESRSGRAQSSSLSALSRRRMAMTVPVKWLAMKIGVVNYKRPVANVGSCLIGESFILDRVREPYTFNSIIDDICHHAVHSGESSYPEDTVIEVPNAEINYFDYQEGEYTDGRFEVDREAVKQMVIEFLERHYGKKEAQEIQTR